MRPETRTGRRLALAAIAVAAVAGFFLLSRVVPTADLQRLLEAFSQRLGAWTYLLVGAFAFAETGAFVGLVVPGETAMILGGAVAGQGAIDIFILIGIAWTAAWAGDSASFLIGRKLGRGFVLRHGPRFGVHRERYEQVEGYFERHGGKTIFLGRFVGIVRALAPFIAGSSGMRYGAFVPYSILGTGLWSATNILIGYLFSRSIETAAEYAGRGAFLLGALIVVVAGSVVLYRRLREPRNRRAAVDWLDRHAATAWAVALARQFRPQLRFLWARVVPGGTFGLEFTTLMAALAVSGFVLVAYTAIVTGNAGPTPGDSEAIDVVGRLQLGWLPELARGVTALGSLPVVMTLAAICGLLLAAWRRWAELAVLACGLALISLGVFELKEIVDRPRPTGGLVEAGGASFPSGHAARSTFYLWLAVTVAIRLRPGMTRGAAVIATGLALTALVGLSRVYLDVHYLSDVNAGWALGAAAFSLCAAVALVVSTLRTFRGPLRQNGSGARTGPADAGRGDSAGAAEDRR